MAHNYIIIAQAASTGGQSPLDFLQYGVLGLIIVAILFGWLWAKPSVDQLKADKAKTELQRDGLIEAYENKIIPVLAEVQQNFIPAVVGMTQSMKDLKVEVAQLKNTIAGLSRGTADDDQNPTRS